MSWSDRQYGLDGPSWRDDRPLGSWWLIGITIVASILVWSVGGGAGGRGADAILDNLALRRSDYWGLEVWRAVTYLFLHGGVWHLLFNMVMLFFVGIILEPTFGTRKFVILYLSFGAAAVAGFALEPLFTSQPARSVIGASGATLGLVVLLGTRFPQMTIRFWGVIPIKCWALAAIIVGIDLLQILANRGSDNVSHSVHLAGAFSGFFYGLLWPRLESRLAEQQELRRQAGERRERERRVKDNVEMDRILKKISEQGMDKLSPREREFMIAQSERLKSNRRS